jgi:uncharacterized protein (DUF58 family)
MDSYERFYDPKVLARVGRLELRAKMVVEGVITGMHRSPYQGQSVEFADHRPYVPGDDPRHIDWKVLGRADRIVLKRYEEETNLRGHVILDSSESMRYSSHASTRERTFSKYEYGGTLAASIAYLLQRQHDGVGLTLFDSEVRARIPVSTHPATLLRLAEVMDATAPAGKTGLGGVLAGIAESLPRRGLVVIISDLFAPPSEVEEGLRAFTLRRHDVMVFHVLDEAELTFPFEGNTLFHGLEGYPEIMAEPRSLRDAYLEALHAYLDRVEKACSTLGIHYLRTHTGEPLDAAIVAVISARAHAARTYR